jgi:ketosteroid isomerase-like protein
MADVTTASVAELTQGVLKMMRFAYLKTATFFVAFLGIVLAAGVLAQYHPANLTEGAVALDSPATRSGSSSAASSPRGDVEKEILSLERKWAAGLANRDKAAVDQILADEIVVTDPVGRTWDKQRYLAELGTNAWGLDFFELRDISIHVFARAAVVTGRAVVKTNASNPNGTGNYRATNTYILRDGQWRCVASHNSCSFDEPVCQPVPSNPDPTFVLPGAK